MAEKFTDEQMQQISGIVRGALEEQKRETDDQARARIMSIPDSILRQKAIEENWHLFRGGAH